MPTSPDSQPKRDAREVQARAYSPPRVEWEEEFDVVANLASACAKVALQNLACNVAPSS